MGTDAHTSGCCSVRCGIFCYPIPSGKGEGGTWHFPSGCAHLSHRQEALVQACADENTVSEDAEAGETAGHIQDILNTCQGTAEECKANYSSMLASAVAAQGPVTESVSEV